MTGSVKRQITNRDTAKAISTGYFDGGALTINAGDPSLVDRAEGSVIFKDDFSSPERILDPELLQVNFPAKSGIALPNISTHLVSAYGIDREGKDFHRPIDFTDEERRDAALLGRPVHLNKSTIDVIDEQVFSAHLDSASFNDHADSVRPIKKSGGKFRPNGVNLKFDREVGRISTPSIVLKTNKKNPNFIDTPEILQVPFVYEWEDGASDFNSTVVIQDIITDSYDDKTGGVGVPNGVVPEGSWTVQKFFSFEGVALQFGSNFYDSALEAYKNRNEEFNLSPNFEDLIPFAKLLIRSGGVSLLDPTEAIFIESDRFGIGINSINALLRTAHISAEISAPQSIPNGAGWTDILFDVEINDKHNFTHDEVVNPELFTADTDMVVTIESKLTWEAAANRNFKVRVLKNGAAFNLEGCDDSNNVNSCIDTDVSRSNIRLLKDDTIKVQAQHNNGSARDVIVNGTYISIQQNI